MNEQEKRQIDGLIECLNSILAHKSSIEFEITPAPQRRKNFFSIFGTCYGNVEFYTDIELFPEALSTEFVYVEAAIRKRTSITQIHPNKNKTGYIFRK